MEQRACNEQTSHCQPGCRIAIDDDDRGDGVEPIASEADDLRQPEGTKFGSELKEGEIGVHVGSGILPNDYGIIRLLFKLKSRTGLRFSHSPVLRKYFYGRFVFIYETMPV